MVRSSNGKTEWLRSELLVEDLAIVESEIICEVNWSDYLSNGCHELIAKHVFDVVHSFRVTFTCFVEVQQDDNEVCLSDRDDFVVCCE